MKVFRLVAPKKMLMLDEPQAPLVPGHVRIGIDAVGVCGSDLHRFRGMVYENEDPDHKLILGHEFAATVIETGKGVTTLPEGTRVAVEAGIHCGSCEWCLKGMPNLCPDMRFCGVPPIDGALVENLVWPADLLYPLAENLTFDDGVMCEIFSIALHSIDLANMRPGQTAAVLGSGPIGASIVQALRRLSGATVIFATDILDYRCAFASENGADFVMNAHKTDVVAGILDHTRGRGVDVIFECAGVNETIEQAIQLCTGGGKMIWVGIPEDDRTPFLVSPARRKGLTVRMVRRSNQHYHRTLSLLERGTLDARDFVTHHFPFTETEKAFHLADRYEDGVMKAIISPSGRSL